MQRVLAFVGSLALGFAALIHAIIAGVALFSGKLIGALGEVAATQGGAVAESAKHDALVAKLIAAVIGAIAALEFGGSLLLRHGMRRTLVPVAVGAAIVTEVVFAIWARNVSSLDAIVVACAVFAGWTWHQLPRPAAAPAA